jgi:predicted nuclease of predicted toxin-antitoxin system
MRFFFDNNLSANLAHGMREFGEDVVHLTDHFPQDAVDSEWLPFVGENQLVLVTRDERIRWKPAEIAAVKVHKVAVFFLGGKKLKRCDLIEQVVRNWRRMKQVAATEHRPFAIRVPPHGATFKHVAL